MFPFHPNSNHRAFNGVTARVQAAETDSLNSRSQSIINWSVDCSPAPQQKQAFAPKVMECCSKTSFCSKSEGVLPQNKLLDEKWWSVVLKRAFAPKVMECCSKTSFCSKSYGVLLQNILLLQKWWSLAPKQDFAPKVLEGCSKTSFCSKSDGVLLQNKFLLQKSCSKTSFCSKSDGVLLPKKTMLQNWWRVAPKQAFAPKVM